MKTRGPLSLRIVPKPFVHTCPWNHPQDFNENQTGDKPSDMGPPGHSSGAAGSESSGEYLYEKPVSEEDKRRYFKELKKENDGDKGQDPRARIEKEVPAHDTGNSPARPDRGDLRTPVGEKVDESGHDAAQNVKEKISDMSEVILDVVTEDIEKPHVPQDVKNSSMKKHRRQEREDLLECREVNRDRRIRVSERNNAVEEEGVI